MVGRWGDWDRVKDLKLMYGKLRVGAYKEQL